ncbi:MAG: MBL fold metallo-hydrolase [Nocardioides sp.]
MPGIEHDDRPLDAPWIHGHRRGRHDTDPVLQVRAIDEATYVIRQSKTVTFEAPFLYLLIGSERALLLDTGAVESAEVCSVRRCVDDLLPAGLPLVVAHTHGHGDHVAGDGQFADRRATVVVDRGLAAVVHAWGFTRWPDEEVVLDLGGRALEVTGIPGHQESAIAVFDPKTGVLLTGDSVYPGRLYAGEAEVFAASTERLVAFAEARPVTQVLGCHIELARDGRDYPTGTRYQPDEAPLPLSMADLVRIGDGVRAAAGRPGVHDVGPARLWNGPCYPSVARQVLQLAWGRALGFR